ncbi:MAG: hypothetical protein ACYC91_18975 [Solirubrobacteraceae bacterium]
MIGSSQRSSGKLRYAIADAQGGRRTVVALVERDGLITDRFTVGHYLAPGPARPGAVRALVAVRRGTLLVVHWRAARGAVRYAVTLQGAHGMRLGRLVGASARTASFDAVRRDQRVLVGVRAVDHKGRIGPLRLLHLRAARR